MRKHPSPRRRRPNGVVHYATGYGVRVYVSRGHLIVEDGIGRERHTARFNRATGRLCRLVLVASTGYVSIEAVKWMTDTGCALVQLDHAGRTLATTAAMGSDNPALRRAQARASTRPVGVEISHQLLAAKLTGQHAIAATLDADQATQIASQIDALAKCHELADLRLIEAQAAAAYWAAWRGVRIAFATKDADRVPDHWTRFSQRVSPATGSPRVAADPINAMLNLCYALLEAESRIARLAVGLDTGIGILHTDQRARDSLALDLMEAARPAVDGYILDLVATRPFRAADFAETSAGQCRIMPRLARQLAATSRAWAGEVAPHAEDVARQIASDAGITAPLTTLTGEARRLARPAGSRTKPHTALRPVAPARTCHDCGTTVRSDRKRCPACHAAANAERLQAQQADEVARRQNTGQHPSQQPAVRERIGQTQRSHWAATRGVSPAGGFTGRPSEFRRLILPRLAGIAPRILAAATGLSPGYCALIRDGRRVPHIRHWAAFHLASLNHQER